MNRARFILVGLLIALVARGAEEAKKTDGDSIAASRRELEALKAERIDLRARNVTVPELDAPEDTFRPQDSLMSKKARDELKAKAKAAKSANWLIDAMEKNASTEKDSRKPSGSEKIKTGEPRLTSGTLSGDQNTRLDVDALSGRRNSDVRQPATTESREAKAPKEEVINPLAGFMASWMTPRDYELLQKSPGPNGSSGPVSASPVSSGLGAASDPDGMLQRFDRSAGAAPVNSSPGPTVAVRENPYLQSTLRSMTETPSVIRELSLSPPTVVAPSAPSAPPVSNYEPVAPVDRIAPFVLEKLKRSDDAKYFPQLKRF